MRYLSRRPVISAREYPVVRLSARTRMFHYMRGSNGSWWKVYAVGKPSKLVGREENLPKYIIRKYHDGKRQHGPGFGQGHEPA